MNTRIIIAAVLLGLGSIPTAFAENNDNEDKATLSSAVTAESVGEAVKELASCIKINGYAQGGYDYNSSDNSNSFNFKRAIVWAKANITRHFSFLYMHDFKASALEYHLTYSASRALNVRMGQFKNSLSMENPMSPAKLELVNCYSQPVMYMAGFSDPLMGNNGGRDLGLLIYGEAGNSGIKYEFGIMNGQGINKSDGNPEKDFLLKLEYRPIEPLRIVASGQIGRGHAAGANPFNPTIGEGDNYKRNRFTVGAEYSSDEFSVRSEYLKGWNGPVQTQGVYATALKPLTGSIDAVASFDWLDKNTHMDARQTNYTIGVQYWFFKKCRIQAQYTRCCPSYAKDYNYIQLQTQVGF